MGLSCPSGQRCGPRGPNRRQLTFVGGYVAEVKTMALPTLRHRVQVRPEAELDGVTADSALSGVMATVPVPR